MLGSAFPPARVKGDCLWSSVQICQLLLDWTADLQYQPDVGSSFPRPEFAVSSLCAGRAHGAGCTHPSLLLGILWFSPK